MTGRQSHRVKPRTLRPGSEPVQHRSVRRATTDRMPGIGSTSSRTPPLLPRTPIEFVAKSIELLSQQATSGIVLALDQFVAIDQPQLPDALTDRRHLLDTDAQLVANADDDGVDSLVVAPGFSAGITPEQAK
jgi:hypothetical protein